MPTGVISTNLPEAAVAFELIGHFSGNTVRISLARLAHQLSLEAIAVSKETVAELLEDLSWADGARAAVWGEPEEALRGVYLKSGAVGAGSWSRIGDLPQSGLTTAQLAAKADVAELIAIRAAVIAAASDPAVAAEMVAQVEGLFDAVVEDVETLTDGAVAQVDVLTAAAVAATGADRVQTGEDVSAAALLLAQTEGVRDATVLISASQKAFRQPLIFDAILQGLIGDDAVAVGATYTATGDDVNFIGLYRRTGDAATEIAQLPKAALVTDLVSRLPSPFTVEILPPESGWLLVFRRGKAVLAGFRSDGEFRVFKPWFRDQSLLRSWLAQGVQNSLLPEGSSALPLPSEGGWLAAFGTPEKAVGFRNTGEVIGRTYVPGMRYRRIDGTDVPVFPLPAIVSFGDSTTAGAGASSIGTSWYSKMAARLGLTLDSNLFIFGVGGQAPVHIAARIGAVPITMTVTGNTVPGSGQALITAIDPPPLFSGSSTATRTIAGMSGGDRFVITKTGTATYNIARETAGDAVAVAAGSVFVPDQAVQHRDKVLILRAGTNSRTDPYGTIEYLRLIVDRMTPYCRAVLVISPRGTNDDVIGTANHTNLLTMERLGRTVFGDSWIDERQFLTRDALGVLASLGLGPTRDSGQIAQDNADIANDVIPTSLRSDTIHSNDFGQEAEAWLFSTIVKSRGLI